MPASRRAYRGRIVKMDAAFAVIDDGVLWIDGNRIAAVTHAAEAKPINFEHITPVALDGTIFPGLIELHNHLSYDILQLWQVPKLFMNRDQWGSPFPDYRRLISGPMMVLGKSPGFTPAIIRYVEAKCLTAGVTTSQGITLQMLNVKRFYRGVVRNVEEPLDPSLPAARAKISDVEAKSAEKFLKMLQAASCALLHLSEGADEIARQHFLDLRINDTKWALAPSLAGIHCVALTPADFDRLAAAGSSMVWSPLSNLMLYGKTADIKAAKAAGVRIGLGSDWSPSGSKNLLRELRVARAASNGVLSDREIVAAATTVAAGILRWDRHLGTLEPSKLADFIVVSGKGGDPYAQLLTADEKSIVLVVIDGVPRLAARPLSLDMAATAEPCMVGGAERLLNLHDAAADEAVEGLTLKAATERLADGLQRLPALAAALESQPKHGPLAAAAPTWTLVLDHDEPQDVSIRPRFAGKRRPGPTARLSEFLKAAAKPLSEVLGPMQLDALTAVDEPDYLGKLKSQINIPKAIKDRFS
jgi:hypothetical protein